LSFEDKIIFTDFLKLSLFFSCAGILFVQEETLSKEMKIYAKKLKKNYRLLLVLKLLDNNVVIMYGYNWIRICNTTANPADLIYAGAELWAKTRQHLRKYLFSSVIR